MKLKDGEIIAGKSISGIRLGWTLEKLVECIGNDYIVDEMTECKIIMIENAHFWISNNNNLFQIMVFGDFKGKFLNCIGIGSTLKDVEDNAGEWKEELDAYLLTQCPGICFQLLDDPDDDDDDDEWDESQVPIEYISVFIDD